MKRQRTSDLSVTDLDGSKISYQHVLGFLRQNTLKCQELVTLAEEIDRLYAIQANTVVQDFPVDLLLQIFSQVRWTYYRKHHEFKFWLGYRTVSKSWQVAVTKLDFSGWFTKAHIFQTLGFRPEGILSILKFTKLHCSHEEIRILKEYQKLTNLKCLGLNLARGKADQEDTLSQLTQLIKLGVDGASISERGLLPLTNLQGLTLRSSPIENISTLTNLRSLKIWGTTKLTQEATKDLTKLTRLTSGDPNFFRSGRGFCVYSEGKIYDGEWLDGRHHGKGFCRYENKDEYNGDWIRGEWHGQGVLRFWARNTRSLDVSWYTGDWIEDTQTGKGTRYYSNGDSYEGSWYDGDKIGYGVYRFKDGGVYEGEWGGNEITGQGKCVYPNGDVYEGGWVKGSRHGYGVYFVAKSGEKIEGNWEENRFLLEDDDVAENRIQPDGECWDSLIWANSDSAQNSDTDESD